MTYPCTCRACGVPAVLPLCLRCIAALPSSLVSELDRLALVPAGHPARESAWESAARAAEAQARAAVERSRRRAARAARWRWRR